MRAADIMTPAPVCCAMDDSVRDAAREMADHDCGIIPIVDDTEHRHVVGVVTDRDLTLRVLAAGRPADLHVAEVMTPAPDCVTPDADIESVERLMADRQVRRVVVVDEDGACVGVIAQADLARASRAAASDVSPFDVARTVERISEPGRV